MVTGWGGQRRVRACACGEGVTGRVRWPARVPRRTEQGGTGVSENGVQSRVKGGHLPLPGPLSSGTGPSTIGRACLGAGKRGGASARPGPAPALHPSWTTEHRPARALCPGDRGQPGGGSTRKPNTRPPRPSHSWPITLSARPLLRPAATAGCSVPRSTRGFVPSCDLWKEASAGPARQKGPPAPLRGRVSG